MNYNDLQKVNEQIRTTDIKGKAYAEVNERIKAFRQLFPNGGINTELLVDGDGKCIIKATVTDENGFILGTGIAYEKEGSSYINKTSYIENCETSAVGRALGMLGIGIDTSVASFEEVSNAIEQQEAEKPIIKQQMLTIEQLCKEKGKPFDKEKCEKLTKGKADKAIAKLMRE